MEPLAQAQQPHILMLPFAQQGHINPLLQLSRKLALEGFNITFVVSESLVPTNNKDSQKAATSAPSNISFYGILDLVPPERSRGSNMRDSLDSMTYMERAFVDLLDKFHRQGQKPVSFIITDAFIVWSQKVASSFGIPCISVFTSNATCCSLLNKSLELIENGILPVKRDKEGNIINDEKIQGIPGVPDLLPEDIPYDATFDASHFRFKFAVEIAKAFRHSTAVILNTFEELEKDAVAALRAEKKIFPVGPLLLQLPERPSRLDVNYWAEDVSCLTWLDKQAPSSVVYISLGSVASLTIPQFQEFALGLEASNQSFIWVVRPDSINLPLEEVLPENFLSRTKDRGLIISWGPQLLILSHPAVGAFLTQCGWNSFIENLSCGGLPMLCWPHVAEQRLNRILFVDHWHIGMRFNHLPDGSLSKEEVSRALKDIIHSSLGQELRENAHKLKEMGAQSVLGGSSRSSFKELSQYLLNHIKEQDGQEDAIFENGSNGVNIIKQQDGQEDAIFENGSNGVNIGNEH